MKVPKGTVYFSVLDRQAESFIDKAFRRSEVEKSLVFNILFEKAVLVPDIFFFISRGLAQHIGAAASQNRQSLIAAGVEEGVVISAFRDPGLESFHSAYELVRDTGIRGLLKAEVCEMIIGQLDDAARSAEKFSRIPWPDESVGAMYEERLTRFFRPQGDAPPDESSQTSRLWDDTRIWRNTCFENAKILDSGGFRRGSYLATLGESLGIRNEPVDDIQQLFDRVRGDPLRLRALKVLCRWINECYSYNQARAFRAIPSFPNFDSQHSQMLLNSLEPTARASEPPGDVLPPDVSQLMVSALMPPMRMLLSMEPKRLIALRYQSAGEAYHAALEEWRKSPLDLRLREEVASRFKDYARSISYEAARQSMSEEALLRLALIGSAVLGTALGGAASTAMGGPELSGYLAMGSTAIASYDYWRNRPRRQQHTLTAKLEVNLPQSPET